MEQLNCFAMEGTPKVTLCNQKNQIEIRQTQKLVSLQHCATNDPMIHNTRTPMTPYNIPFKKIQTIIIFVHCLLLLLFVSISECNPPPKMHHIQKNTAQTNSPA
eukprot:970902_1